MFLRGGMTGSEAVNHFNVSEEEQWAPLSDLMAALFLLFMLIAAVSAIAARPNSEPIPAPDTAHEFKNQCDQIYKLLKTRFDTDGTRWATVVLTPSASIRFRDADILFQKGSAVIGENFKSQLAVFFPIYMKTISEFGDDILEIRIEGHTSSEFAAAVNDKDAYFKNMELSQDRTRTILQYVLSLPEAKEYEHWAQRRLTANGLSSSKPIPVYAGVEGKVQSRRVEFRVLAKSCLKAGIFGDD